MFIKTKSTVKPLLGHYQIQPGHLKLQQVGRPITSHKSNDVCFLDSSSPLANSRISHLQSVSITYVRAPSNNRWRPKHEHDHSWQKQYECRNYWVRREAIFLITAKGQGLLQETFAYGRKAGAQCIQLLLSNKYSSCFIGATFQTNGWAKTRYDRIPHILAQLQSATSAGSLVPWLANKADSLSGRWWNFHYGRQATRIHSPSLCAKHAEREHNDWLSARKSCKPQLERS